MHLGNILRTGAISLTTTQSKSFGVHLVIVDAGDGFYDLVDVTFRDVLLQEIFFPSS